MNKILLIEDDNSFGYILSEYLKMHDLKVDWAKSGEEGLVLLKTNKYNLGIIDVMLPGLNGYEVASEIRNNFKDLPFIFLSAKSLKIDKLMGFKSGADDFVTKPVDEELLLAKINAIINRTKSKVENTPTYHIGAYEFNAELQELKIATDKIHLTKKESDLLLLLSLHRNTLLTRKKALDDIWMSSDEFSRKSMDVFISKLRKYLSKDANIKIKNIHGQGFVLEIKEA